MLRVKFLKTNSQALSLEFVASYVGPESDSEAISRGKGHIIKMRSLAVKRHRVNFWHFLRLSTYFE